MREMSKTCIHCGSQFTGTNAHGRSSWRKRKYCSYQCKSDAQIGNQRAPVLTKSCEACGRKFRNRRKSGRTIEPDRWEKQRYCSPACKYVGMKGLEPHNKGKRLDLSEQFFRHVDKNTANGCWFWTGVKNTAGYGGLQVNGKRALAHRISYIIHHGAIPEADGFHGNVVCHRCDNPSCVNPEHLFLGSQYANMADRDAKGRRVAPAGESHGMVQLNERDVLSIRDLAGRYSQKELAKMFSISNSMVSLIVNRKNWTHI